MPRPILSIITPQLHPEFVNDALYWLKHCNGSKEEALALLRHPYDFTNDDDIKVLQTVLAL